MFGRATCRVRHCVASAPATSPSIRTLWSNLSLLSCSSSSPSSSSAPSPSLYFLPRRHKSCGIVGLANVGKSTLFNALTQTQLAQAANYPFCTIDPNSATVAVNDPLLHTLAQLAHSRRTISTQLELVDIAGLIRGASQGAGMGAKFLTNIRDVDVVLHVVRCFDNDDVIHIHSKVDPLDDMACVEEELMLADLATIEKRIENAKKKSSQTSAADADVRQRVLDRCNAALNAGVPVLDVVWSEDEQPIVDELRLLSNKPLAIVCNVDEHSAATGNHHSAAVHAAIHKRNTTPLTSPSPSITVRPQPRSCIVISAQLEADAVSSFDSDEARREFLSLSSLTTTGLDQVVRECARLLSQSVYYTVGEQEARAWLIEEGSSAVEAAGKIHSDIAKGLISVEVMRPEDVVAMGGVEAVKAAGKMRIEGKDYTVKHGDILMFRHGKTKVGK